MFTSGVAGARPGPGWSVAASICSAMEGLTRALASELAPVRVNIVSPGVVKTPLWRGMTDEARDTRRRASVLGLEGNGWDIGGGWGPVTSAVLESFPRARIVLHDFSEPMLEAVAEICPAAQLAWEAPMACGYGACYGCAVEIDGEWKRLCVEGPVLAA